MKGIILAGGSGTRLYPITKSISKQLVPIYDKPMIYYPLCTLMAGGIKDILIITTPDEQNQFQNLLGDGSEWGINLSYAVQPSPDGLAQAYVIGEQFIGDDTVAMILGDNLFHSHSISQTISQNHDIVGAMGFAVHVQDPERYGVYEFDDDMNVLSIVEKPADPKSNYVNSGLYLTDSRVSEIAKKVEPSERGELEITSVLDAYLQLRELKVGLLGKDSVWLDTGTFESLSDASEYVRVVETRTGQIIGSPEEVAYRSGFISREQLSALTQPLLKSGYGAYLQSL